jgi:hypothetical protein
MKILITESHLKSVVSEQMLNRYKNTGKQSLWDKDYTAETMAKIKKSQEEIELVKKTWNYEKLNKAIDWWNKWTINNVVVDKYSKNWNISTNETHRIMAQYREALKGLTLNYINDTNNSAIAYVQSSNPKVVIVNAANTTGSNPFLIFLHELQHLLFFIKPTHPEMDIKDNLGINPYNYLSVFSTLGNDAINKNYEPVNKTNFNLYFKPKMIEMGLNIDMQNYYNKHITYSYSKKDTYIPEGTEVLSRLKIVKELMGKFTYEDITPREIGQLNNKESFNKPIHVEPNLYWLTLSLLFSPKMAKNIVNGWNLVAKTNIKPQTAPNFFKDKSEPEKPIAA